MIAALALNEWLDAAVAAGTLILAAATYWLARKTSEQSGATVRLALTAERQLQLTTEPKLRVARIGDAETVDVDFLEEDTEFMVVLENTGAGLGEIEEAALTISGGNDGGGGELTYSFGTWKRRLEDHDLSDPTIKPNWDQALFFELATEERARWHDGGTLSLRVVCRSLGSGTRYYLSAIMAEDPPGSREWRSRYDAFNEFDNSVL